MRCLDTERVFSLVFLWKVMIGISLTIHWMFHDKYALHSHKDGWLIVSTFRTHAFTPCKSLLIGSTLHQKHKIRFEVRRYFSHNTSILSWGIISVKNETLVQWIKDIYDRLARVSHSDSYLSIIYNIYLPCQSLFWR